MKRVVKTEKFFSANGSVVLQLTEEETTESGMTFRLPPRNPTKEEFLAAEDAFSLAQSQRIETLEQEIATANARIASLLESIPWNPRVIDATSFFNRLTLDEFARLSTSEDPAKVHIAKKIINYKTNDWPIVFESIEFQQMMQYLLDSGEIKDERMAELTRDATREEAYSAE